METDINLTLGQLLSLILAFVGSLAVLAGVIVSALCYFIADAVRVAALGLPLEVKNLTSSPIAPEISELEATPADFPGSSSLNGRRTAAVRAPCAPCRLLSKAFSRLRGASRRVTP